MHAPFHSTAIVGAGDNFLAGITAFLKVDIAKSIEIEHLGNKHFDGLSNHFGTA